jgi:hypothetical protein
MAFGPIHFAVRAWAGVADAPDPVAVKAIPPLLRRRVTAMGKRALGAACQLPDADKARFVFSSRHGEFVRTLAILKSIAADEPLSPTDFSMSVHHALASLLSIAKENHNGHVAIAAGEESFCYGLIEALGALAESPDPVILIHSDEPLPEAYGVFNPQGDLPIGLALLLARDGGEDFSFEAADHAGTPTASIATEFMNFLQCSDRERNAFGATGHWRWVRHGDR